MKATKRILSLLLVLLLVCGVLPLSAAAPLPDYDSEWPNFRGSETNMAITSAPTATSSDAALLKWAQKYGTGWAAAPVPPILVNDYLYTASGSRVMKIDKETGELLQEGKLNGSVGFALNNLVYAEGMLFALIGNGQVQALNAETLESLWISEKLGGQTLCPITYKNGYIYTGTWNRETENGDFFCLSVADEDPAQTDEEKKCVWKYTSKGGFYWAGAYASDDYVIFGSDDGRDEGDYAEGSKLTSVNPVTGDVIDQLENLQGDLRSSIAYDETTGCVYFSSKGGRLYKVKVNEDGTFDHDYSYYSLGGMSTGTPVVYKGRIYLGGSGPNQFGPDGHYLRVVDAATMQEIYSVPTKGYVQSTPLLSTAYEAETGKVYIYITYNMQPGGIMVIEDSAGQTEPVYRDLFLPQAPYANYCICSLICDSEGTLYYKNDSCYLMAVENNPAYLTALSVSGGNARMTEDFSGAQLTYEVLVDRGTEKVTVTAESVDGLTIDGAAVSQKEIALKDGAATVEVIASKDGKTRTYTLSIREVSNDAALSALDVNESNAFSIDLSPEDFSPSVLEYTSKEGSEGRTFLNVWPLANDAGASIRLYPVYGVAERCIAEDGTIEKIASPSGGRDRWPVYFADGLSAAVIRVEVTAEDGETTQSYRLVLRKTDEAAPVITPAAADRTGVSTADIRFSADELSSYYYAVVESGAAAPSIDTTGEGTACSYPETVLSLSDLTASGKNVYVVLKDVAGNVSDAALFSLPAATAAQVAGEIDSVTPPAKDAESLTLPEVPEGYTVAVKSSSSDVVSLNGSIVPPAAATEVTLVFTVTRTADGTTADTAPITITVPAKTSTAPEPPVSSGEAQPPVSSDVSQANPPADADASSDSSAPGTGAEGLVWPLFAIVCGALVVLVLCSRRRAVQD